MTKTKELRSFYANLMLANLGVSANSESKLRDAFTNVPREDFVGDGPWSVYTPAGYVKTPSANPAYIYQDTTIALDIDQGINNGQPMLHAMCIAALGVKEGDVVLHIGCGTGYYTAILGWMTGDSGNVAAYEIEKNLAFRARENLADYSGVKVICRSGSEGTLPDSDVIYVNAGATDPMDIWLDALCPGGRLLFPLTPEQGPGGMLLITRDSDKNKAVFSARFIMRALFIPCIGARNVATAKNLAEAFRREDLRLVKSLHRNNQPDKSCWVSGDTWWLSKEANR